MLKIFVLALIGVAFAEWKEQMENPGMFEGDILLDPDEKEATFGKWNGKGTGYASIKGGRWPGAKIYYQVSGGVSRSVINQAIADYHKYTCLRFYEGRGDGAYLNFYPGGGCSSPVGYRKGRRNDVSLGNGCQYKGTVMHEIGHSIGLYHEQSRPDRDSHVTIQWNNIASNMRFNFNKQPSQNIDSLGTPYDYDSMMHYGQTAFGSGRMTIKTKDSSKQRVIGNRRGFSEIDKVQINRMYCNGNGGGIKPPPPPPPPSECRDNNSMCPTWAGRGECTNNPGYMLKNCKKSCDSCSGGSCTDSNSNCATWASRGECGRNPWMRSNCKKSCKTC